MKENFDIFIGREEKKTSYSAIKRAIENTKKIFLLKIESIQIAIWNDSVKKTMKHSFFFSFFNTHF